MKAIDILEWAVENSITFETIGFIDVPSENDECTPQDEEWWMNEFGTLPPKPIPEGKYLYYYNDTHDTINNERPDAELETSDNVSIYLYRVEDLIKV